MKDAKDIKFGASSVGKLMSGGYFQKEKNRDLSIIADYEQKKDLHQAGQKLNGRAVGKRTAAQTKAYNKAKENVKKDFSLGEGAKSYVRGLWLRYNTGYRDIIRTTGMLKGMYTEQKVMEIFQDVFPELGFPVSCERFAEDDNYRGIMDFSFKTADLLIDAKSPEHVKSWFEITAPPSLYEIQVQVYMRLYKMKRARLFYGLCDMPQNIYLNEVKRLSYKFSVTGEDVYENQDFLDALDQLEINHHYDLDAFERAKWFDFEYDDELLSELDVRVEAARNYYATLTHNNVNDIEQRRKEVEQWYQSQKVAAS